METLCVCIPAHDCNALQRPPGKQTKCTLGLRISVKSNVGMGNRPRALHPAKTGLARWRLVLLERLRPLQSPSTGGLPAALLLGHTEGVDYEQKDRFTRTGHPSSIGAFRVAHRLDVALLGTTPVRCCRFGLQMTVGRWIPDWPRRSPLVNALFGLGGLLLLAPMLGSGSPAWRAAIALGIAGLARHAPSPGHAPRGSGRRVDALSLWAFALALECLRQPQAIEGLSVQLSYGATLALIWTYPRLSAGRHALQEHGELRPCDSLGRPRHALVAFAGNQVARGVRAGLLASCIASLATLPIIWIHFW